MPQYVRPGNPVRSRRSPGGTKIKISKAKKPAHASCAICGAKLSGVPKVATALMRKLSKTQSRPERPFGGVLCTKCSRSLFKNKTRLKAGTMSVEQADLRQMGYLKQLK